MPERPRARMALAVAWALAAGLPVAAPPAAAAASDPYRAITVVSWGGPYERSQLKAYFEPFTKATGIRIDIERYDGGLDELRRQVSEGDLAWDLVDMTMADNRAACRQGLLEPIDHSRLHPAPDGTPAADDFIDGALTECGVAQIVYAMVAGLQPRRVPGGASRPDRGHLRPPPVPGDEGAPARPRGEPRMGAPLVRRAAPGPLPAPQHGAGPEARVRAARPHPRPRGLVDVDGPADRDAHQRRGGDRLGVQRGGSSRWRRFKATPSRSSGTGRSTSSGRGGVPGGRAASTTSSSSSASRPAPTPSPNRRGTSPTARRAGPR